MKILVLGAGMMARAIVHSLAGRDEIEAIAVADREPGRAETLVRSLGRPSVVPLELDVRDEAGLARALGGTRVAVSAVPYFYNLGVAKAAIRAGAHFCDLGGNSSVVAAELALDRDAKAREVTLIPDCGLAPGLVNVLAADLVRRLDRAERLEIRVGGLPQVPRPPLDYEIVFSPHGLINEYMEKATVIEDGRVVEVPSLTGCEPIAFPPLFPNLEAFHTSGGSSTLPQTLLGRVRNLNYKTIRYPGHVAKVKAMADLGFFDAAPRPAGGTTIAPRDLAVDLLAERLSFGEPDLVLLRVTAHGTQGGGPTTLVYEMIDRHDPVTGLSAMMRTTGFPIAEVAYLLATGAIDTRGAVPQELCVPVGPFLAGLRAMGLRIEEVPPRS